MDVCVWVCVWGDVPVGVGCVGGFGYVGWGVWGGVSVCVGVGGCVGVCVCVCVHFISVLSPLGLHAMQLMLRFLSSLYQSVTCP